MGECFFLVPSHRGSPRQRAIKWLLLLLLLLFLFLLCITCLKCIDSLTLGWNRHTDGQTPEFCLTLIALDAIQHQGNSKRRIKIIKRSLLLHHLTPKKGDTGLSGAMVSFLECSVT